MSRWTSTEVDESAERALFARRAQSLATAAVPSLEAVLAAANREDERIVPSGVRGSRSRALVATALAAACVAAAFAKLPRREPRVTITADGDAGIRRAAVQPEIVPGATCSMSDGLLAVEESACVEPPSPRTSAPVVSPAAFSPSDD
ncbi:MAG TPA: hypothetical protein VIF09_02285, partial [Polyangiaceae bacterium]